MSQEGLYAGNLPMCGAEYHCSANKICAKDIVECYLQRLAKADCHVGNNDNWKWYWASDDRIADNK